jgi:hypothetical protein
MLNWIKKKVEKLIEFGKVGFGHHFSNGKVGNICFLMSCFGHVGSKLQDPIQALLCECARVCEHYLVFKV